MKIQDLTLEVLESLERGMYAIFKDGILSDVIGLNKSSRTIGCIGTDDPPNFEDFIESCENGEYEIVLASEIKLSNID